jgi:methionyl-tRNA synthetase
MARFLITSALPYINGIKHLGNLTGSLLPADVYARFLRREGEEVLFICATDEHGTPAELSALEANLDVSEYCHRMHEQQADIYRRFGLSFDHFGRSSSQQNHELTQHVYQKLRANGYIESRATLQAYSNADHRFLPDRYVIGTCPKCGYAAARGDQCESCTSLLDPTDLLQPRSALSNSGDLDFRPTQHLFLKLDALTDDIRTWIGAHPHWPTLTKAIAHKWLDEGLQERCITRDLQWGVPVPEEGQGQRAIPHRLLAGRHVWHARAVDDGSANQEFQLADLLRWQVLHEPTARGLHGRGPRHSPTGRLALFSAGSVA